MADETGDSLENLSDEELIARLKPKQSDKSWSIAEIREVERRGYEFLAAEPELQADLKKVISDFVKKIEEAVRPDVTRISEMGSAWISESESMKQVAAKMKEMTAVSQVANGLYGEMSKASKLAKELTRVTFEPSVLRSMEKNMEAFRSLGRNLQEAANATAGLNFRGVTGPAGPAPLRLVVSDPKTIEAVATPLATSLDAEVQALILKAMTDTANNTKLTSDRLKLGVERALIFVAVWIAAIGTIILVLRRH